MGCCNRKRCFISSCAVSSLLLIAGIILIAAFGAIIGALVKSQTAIKDGTFLEKTWANPKFKVYMQFWVFSVSNAAQVKQGAVAEVVEKGPYSYREYQNKFDIQFQESEGTIKYKENKLYRYDKETSCGSCYLNDTITVPNLAFLMTANILRKVTGGLDRFASRALNSAVEDLLMSEFQEDLFAYNISVGDWIFEGYEDKIISLVTCFTHASISNFTNCLSSNSSTYEANVRAGKALGAGLGIPDKLGIFYGKNDTDDGIYVINDGVSDPFRIGKIMSWNGRSSLDMWLTEEANMLNGTDGTLYPPLVKKGDTLRLFISDICRSVYLKYLHDITIKRLPSYRFYVPPPVFDSNVIDNLGFCLRQSDNMYGKSGCLESGLLNMTSCEPGGGILPVSASSPHFLFAPKNVYNHVKIRKYDTGKDVTAPNQDEYQSTIDIVPDSGTGIQFRRRLQINAAMWHMPGMGKTLGNIDANFGYMIPLIWINESATIDDATADSIYNQLVMVKKVAKGASYAMTAVGAFAVLVCTFILAKHFHDKRVNDDDQIAILGSEE